MALSSTVRNYTAPRVRTGICVRNEYVDREGSRKRCAKAATKERQSPIGAFVCNECGARLVPVNGQRPLFGKLAVIGAVAVVMAGGIVYGAYRYILPLPPPECDINQRLVDKIAGSNPAQVAELARKCFVRKDFNNAVPLFLAAAERGDAGAMIALAQMYDPATFQLNHPFAKPELRQAAKWYRQAADKGAPVEEQRRKLRDLLSEREQKGDAEARLILQDYWK